MSSTMPENTNNGKDSSKYSQFSLLKCAICGDFAQDEKSAYIKGWNISDRNNCLCADCDVVNSPATAIAPQNRK